MNHVGVRAQSLQSRYRKALLFLLSALVASSAAGLFLGAVNYSPAALLDADSREIMIRLRLPRLLFCVFVGGTLSVVGAAYQALFRNPLASPFSLGVSSGAALGASLAMIAGGGRLYGLDTTVCAMAGALAVVALILRMTRRALAAQGASLLLAGVVLSFFCSSVLTLVQYVSDYAQLFRVTRWMMGGIMVAGTREVLTAFLISLSVFGWLWWRSRDLDLMLFGDELAQVKGVEVGAFYRRIFVITSLGVGWIVAQCGVIGFVGVIVPAVVRMFSGPGHRVLLPLAYVAGALLLAICDLLGRTILPPYEIPVGVFTAVIGGPLFVWLLVRSKGIITT